MEVHNVKYDNLIRDRLTGEIFDSAIDNNPSKGYICTVARQLAQMAELVDALGSGPSSGNCVWVQIPFWATEMTGLLASLFCYMEAGAAGRKSVNCPMSIMLRTALESKLPLISCVSHPICMRLLSLEPRLHTVRLFSCFPLHKLCLREI